MVFGLEYYRVELISCSVTLSSQSWSSQSNTNLSTASLFMRHKVEMPVRYSSKNSLPGVRLEINVKSLSR